MAKRLATFSLGGICLLIAACSSTPSGPAACVPGATQACLCIGGGNGVQACAHDGTFSDCVCVGPDAAVPIDAASPGSDTGPGTDAATPGMDAATDDAAADDAATTPVDSGLDAASAPIDAGNDAASAPIDGGVDSGIVCPSPFVVCAGSCIDPRLTPAYCGASGSCTGASAGMNCGGTSCANGRCVWSSCAAAFTAGQTTDGIYEIDFDGSGPAAPLDGYCDMTADGGGWTLVYKIRNDVADIADPWWGMVDLGAGSTFPTTAAPVAVGSHFEGPTRDVRAAFTATLTSPTFRTTMVTSSGMLVLSVRHYRPFDALGSIASGAMGIPADGCVTSSPAQLLFAAASTGASPGSIQLCSFLSGGMDSVTFSPAGGGSCTTGTHCAPMVGDTSIASFWGATYANTTTLFWIH